MIAHSREGRGFIRAVVQHVRWGNLPARSMADIRQLLDGGRNGELPFPNWGGAYHRSAITSLLARERRGHFHQF